MSCSSKFWIRSFPTPNNSSNLLIALFGADVAIFHVLELSLYENDKVGMGNICKISGRRVQVATDCIPTIWDGPRACWLFSGMVFAAIKQRQISQVWRLWVRSRRARSIPVSTRNTTLPNTEITASVGTCLLIFNSRLKTCWYWKVTPYEGAWKVLAETYRDRKTKQQCRTLHRV